MKAELFRIVSTELHTCAMAAIAERQAHAACAARHAKTLEKIREFNGGE